MNFARLLIFWLAQRKVRRSFGRVTIDDINGTRNVLFVLLGIHMAMRTGMLAVLKVCDSHPDVV